MPPGTSRCADIGVPFLAARVAMLDLYAESPYGTKHVLSSAPSFRLAGMNVERGRERIATYAGGCWKVHDLYFPRLDVPAPVIVSVERADGRATRKLGEYSSFSIVDGCAHADGRIIASCRDGCAEWELRDGRSGSWPVIVLESARWRSASA
jgi:hypothetical protein